MALTRRTTAATLLLAAATALAGCTPATPSGTASDAASGIGAWPTFLPTPTGGGEARGSVADPALSYAGSPVVVTLPGGTATVDVQGPSYPADTPVGADQVACTFTVTVSAAGAPVDLAAARFDVLDHTGALHGLTPAPGRTVPDAVAPGATATLTLVTTLPSGEGMLRYAPDGGVAAAVWDYVAETD